MPRIDMTLTLEASTKSGIIEYARRHHVSVSHLAELFFMHLIESDSTPENRFIYGNRVYKY